MAMFPWLYRQPDPEPVSVPEAGPAPAAARRLPAPHHAVFIGPGPLNGKTALVQRGTNPAFVTAQFDDRTLMVPHVQLKLDTPWWGTVAFGWTLFQAKFFRKIS